MSDDLVKSLEWSCRDPVTHEPIDDGDYSNATVSEVKQAIAEITRLRARVAELEAQTEMLRHATDKLRAMLAKLNARHEPLQRAFITAVELLNDAALTGGKDE